MCEGDYMQKKEYNIGLGYVESIKDNLIRQIIFDRHIKNMKWREIADDIGGGNSPENIKALYKKYIEKHPPEGGVETE
jgi:hypothetical protein